MLVCGIDIGTTNLKLALFDERARMVWLKTEESPRIRDSLGPVTDAAALVTKIEDMLIEGWKATGKGLPIAAISTAGVGEDGVYVDAQLNPLGPSIPWFDQRAVAEAAELAHHACATSRAGIMLDPTRTAAKWLWLSRHDKEQVAQARAWISLTDYPLARWASKVFMADTLASRTACFDSVQRKWLAPMLSACGAVHLPEVVCAGSTIGTVSSQRLLQSGAVNEDTRLVAGGHDHPVAAHAIHRIDAMARVDSLGTANVIYGEAPTFTIDAYDPYIAFMSSIEGPSRLACLGVFEFSSTVTRHQGGMESIRQVLKLPRLPGEPGRFSGLQQASERGLLEWATMNARMLIERLDGYGVPDGPIYSTGGWSRSDALLELRASVYGRPIHAPEEKELTVLGAALLASSAVGGSQNFETAVRVVEPDTQWQALYAEIFADFIQTGTTRLALH
jgi:xylulokinase